MSYHFKKCTNTYKEQRNSKTDMLNPTTFHGTSGLHFNPHKVYKGVFGFIFSLFKGSLDPKSFRAPDLYKYQVNKCMTAGKKLKADANSPHAQASYL